ncbi:MAG: 3-dehydroquinate dehydratase / shikimate dehydrogenase [Thermoanaerobaculia bacterium]|jgi:3-dehydroquinate dehydratase type I|nr:3-dehydroquinate dehydratase / shikimate dehydrogenase [Thermoanaerobaculia bacterium]
MKLAVTILEPTLERAIDVIRALDTDHDAVELRVDGFGGRAVDWRAVRAATAKAVIATNRGGGHVDLEAAIEAGIDLVDVEWGSAILDAHRERIVLSHHDYDGMPDVEALVRAMCAERCAHVKIAATPRDFADNARLLAPLDVSNDLTIIGMGSRGLYARILAPFFGSLMQFLSVDEARSAAPGQLTLERARAIYGANRDALRAEKIFAIVGNPAAQSGSPAIHNAIFRERGIAAAYSIFETDSFLDIAEPFARGDRFAPTGLSVTAPFKEEALAFAQRIGAEISPNAREAGAVNTLVRIGARILADNTDVDGFAALIGKVSARSAAVIGAGGTARAALVALRRAGIAAIVFNRTAGKLGARPLGDLSSWRGDLVINTLPRNVAVDLPSAGTIIESAYGGTEAAYGGASSATFTGIDLLRAQAVRQSELFIEACQ